MWDRVLFNAPDLKINNDSGYACTEHPLVGILNPFQPIEHLHRTLGHTGHALKSEHAHGTNK